MIDNPPTFKSLIFQDKKMAFIIWVVFFCYSICAALIFQKLMLPNLSLIQTGSGLITNDANYFDSVASSLASEIKANGWSSMRLYPANGAPGNVAILGALYVFFGQDSSLAIPIASVLHAMGGLFIFLLARELANKAVIGICAGVIAGSLFVLFPSALVWYSQNLKDTYAIAGMLLTLLIWVKAIKNPSTNLAWCWLVLGNLVAMVLVVIVRPYTLKLLLVAALGVVFVYGISAILRHEINARRKLIGFFLIVVVMLVGGIKGTETLGGTQPDKLYANWQDETPEQWQWIKSSWVPENIESYIATASKTRVSLIAYGLRVNAKSMIDEDVKPQRTSEIIAYLPRVLQVALFAPFPSSWFTNFSLPRLVAVGEMSIFYLCVPGIFMLLIYNRRPPVLMALYFACFFLLIYGFTQANIGTLYRYRYGYWFVMLTLGLLGYCTWLDKTGRLKGLLDRLSRPALLVSYEESLMLTAKPTRKEAISSGSAVMGLTLLTFMGFFLRDIMMAQTFGLGPVLDSFFVVLLIPMFIVTVLCMPLGLAFVPIYLEVKERLKHQDSRNMVSRTSFWVIMSLLVVCFILYLTGSFILPILSVKGSFIDIPELISLFDITLPILLFSGIVILGNSVLNANGRAVLSSAAQLVVPISTILALLLFGSSYGVKVVIYGMVIGQLANLLIVQYYLKFYDISLLPRLDLGNHNEWIPLILQYLPLVMSAFFAASAAPVATFLAISLPEGAISALNLGNKVVFFVTGLLGTAISTVMLPYFSELIIKRHIISARRELSFFVLLSTFISVPICIVLFVESELIIRLMFEGRAFSSGDTKLVARVMQYAVVQIPFFVCNSILFKFAIATKHVFATSIIAFLGLLVNIGASIFLMKYMSVGGIALGASVSMLFSTGILILVLVRYWHISKFDALVIFLNWLLFVTFLMCLHFESITGSYAIFFAYVILLIGYFRSLMPSFFQECG